MDHASWQVTLRRDRRFAPQAAVTRVVVLTVSTVLGVTVAVAAASWESMAAG